MATAKSYGYTAPSYGYMQPGQAGPSKGTRRLAASLASQAPQANAAPSSRLPFPSLSGGGGDSFTFNPIGPTTPGGFAGPDAPPAAPPAAPLAPPAAPGADPVTAALGQVAPGGAYDYTTDPVLQQIAGLGKRSRADAASGALSLRKQLAVRYGDEQYARDTLGDQMTAAAAADANRTGVSIPAQLRTSYDQGLRQLEDSYNKGNLWWSGTRATGLQDAANQYQGRLADVTGQQQSALDQIAEQLLMAQTAADEADQRAANDAYARRLALALANQPQAPAATAPAGTEPPPYNPPPTGPAPGTDTPPPVTTEPPPGSGGAGTGTAGGGLDPLFPPTDPWRQLFQASPQSIGASTGGGQTFTVNPVALARPAKKKPATKVDLASLLGGFRG